MRTKIHVCFNFATKSINPSIHSKQVAMGVMVKPPVPGDASYTRWQRERAAVLASLERRANAITSALNALPGVFCAPAGSLYAFPRVQLPPRAVAAAQKQGLVPDVFYCLELLEATGIATTPGSGFGQKDGTWHFRTTILPPEQKIEQVHRQRSSNSERVRYLKCEIRKVSSLPCRSPNPFFLFSLCHQFQSKSRLPRCTTAKYPNFSPSRQRIILSSSKIPLSLLRARAYPSVLQRHSGLPSRVSQQVRRVVSFSAFRDALLFHTSLALASGASCEQRSTVKMS